MADTHSAASAQETLASKAMLIDIFVFDFYVFVGSSIMFAAGVSWSFSLRCSIE